MKKAIFFTSLFPLTFLIADESCCDPCEEHCLDWKFSISPLVWQAHEEGLDYAIKNQSGLGFVNRKGSVKRINFDWDWGVRLNLEYQTCCLWELGIQWTYYRTTGDDSTSANFPKAIFPVWTIPGSSITPSTKASAKWRLMVNLLDFRLGVRYCPTDLIDLQPFLALAFGWLDQNFDIKTSGGVSKALAAQVVLNDDIDMRNDFWGIGPKFGLKTNWHLGCGFSFFGNGDISILYGEFDLNQQEKILFDDLTPATTFLDIQKDKYWLSRVYLDMIFGFRWECDIYCGYYRLGLEAGWEHLFFFGQNQLKRFIDDTNPGIQLPVKGDLTIQGFTLTARFEF